MRAAILVEQQKPLVVGDVSLPKLDHGQVLVKVCYSGICGSQIGEIDGVKGKDPYLPHLLGHEGSGVVEDMGPGVTRLKGGQHVVLHWRKAAGIEASPSKYKWGKRTVNAGWVTTFNEYAIVSENRVTPIPQEFSLETATLYGCAVTTGFGVIHNDAMVKIGESVVVFGVGGVGLCVVLGARLASACPIIAVDIYRNKLDLAREFGATHVIDSAHEDVRETVHGVLGDAGADVAVDNTGVAKIMELAHELTGPRGRTIMVGVPRFDERIRIDSMPLHFGKVITGSWGGDANPSEDIPRYVRLQMSGRFNLDKIISHQFELDRINDAIEQLRTGEVVRAVVKM
jgi:Zn-dependent alcohol dehydrogenase